jgi:hypothetical protein
MLAFDLNSRRFAGIFVSVCFRNGWPQPAIVHGRNGYLLTGSGSARQPYPGGVAQV